MPLQHATLPSGIRLAYESAGTPGKPVILFAHGFPLDHSMWAEQLSGLADVARLIAPDLRGFGESEVGPAPATMESLADDLAALLDVLKVPGPVIFCGLSMGGYVAWQFWRRHAARLAGLILCDTRAVADTAEAAAGRHKTAEHVLAHGTASVAAAMLPKLFGPDTTRDRPELIEATRQVVLRNPPAGVAAALAGMAVRPDVTSWLPEIRLPALVVVGEHDAISPAAEMKGIAEALPDAELLVVPQAGHMAPLERPEPVNAAIRRFLARLG